jgi:hypothetical protein
VEDGSGIAGMTDAKGFCENQPFFESSSKGSFSETDMIDSSKHRMGADSTSWLSSRTTGAALVQTITHQFDSILIILE